MAATEHLHRRISKLSSRIRQLEDALAALHAKHSTEIHPLLHEDLMQADERDEADTPADESMGQAAHTGDAIDAFGTLSISEHGISRFFGPTGGSEVSSYCCIFLFSFASQLSNPLLLIIELAFSKSILISERAPLPDPKSVLIG